MGNVGTAAFGCPVEPCSTMHVGTRTASASLSRTAEGGCPHMKKVPAQFRMRSRREHAFSLWVPADLTLPPIAVESSQPSFADPARVLTDPGRHAPNFLPQLRSD